MDLQTTCTCDTLCPICFIPATQFVLHIILVISSHNKLHLGASFDQMYDWKMTGTGQGRGCDWLKGIKQQMVLGVGSGKSVSLWGLVNQISPASMQDAMILIHFLGFDWRCTP